MIAALAVSGAQTAICNTPITTTAQTNLPSGVYGRATAITSFGSKLLVPAGMGFAGLLAGVLDAPTVLLCAGGLLLAAMAICVALPPVRAFSPNCANTRCDGLQTPQALG